MLVSTPIPYCTDLLHPARRLTREVRVGPIGIGACNPIRVQSMITSDTRDTRACVAEVLGLAKVGCEIVRITAQTKSYAANLEHIAREVRAAGCLVPLVADIHFKPDAALEAAKWVEKIRINPGNYADTKKFAIHEYSDAQYEEELERLRADFSPLLRRCKELGRALRIGTNHGSLSDRIMNRFGDSPLGMVESALEFARIARDHDYHALVFSMKASNPKVMIAAYRLLVARLNQLGADWNYPIHLGVTEAGDGEDGRIKSAIGIGSLLADGIGDTVRVSLTEDSVHEIPVALALVAPFNRHAAPDGGPGVPYDSDSGVPPQTVPGASSSSLESCGVSDGGSGVPPQTVPGASSSSLESCGVSDGGSGVPPQTVPGASSSSLEQAASMIRPDWDQATRGTSSYLPHWRVPGATYAVTFRLKDSIPVAARDVHRQRREILAARLEQTLKTSGSRNSLSAVMALRSEMAEFQVGTIEPTLNESHGECWLKRPEIADLVLDAMKHFDGDRYALLAWSVMPNHVHAILRPYDGQKLEKILHSWKSFTAKQANEWLGQTGGFWEEEYYDHIVRDGEDFRNQVRYVLENPRHGNAPGQWTGSNYGATWEEALGAGRSENGLEQDAPAAIAVTSAEAGTSSSSLEPCGVSDSGSGVPPQTVSGASSSPFCDPFNYVRRSSSPLSVMGHALGGDQPVRVCTTQARWNNLASQIAGMGDCKPEIIVEKSQVLEIDPRDPAALDSLRRRSAPCLITVADGTDMEPVAAFRLLVSRVDARHPILLKDMLGEPSPQTQDPLIALLGASCRLGSLLCDGIGDAILVRGEPDPERSLRLAYNILQAAGTRIFKADYVACPSCGRTLFNLQQTTQRIRAATGHLKGVRIAVMGCIVNGPGEMADADFGYVGGAPNKINLYVGRTAVQFNIPEDDAVARLIDLIREHGKWADSPTPENTIS